MTVGLLTTAGLVGLFMAVTTLALISYGTNERGGLAVGSSMGVTAFSLMIVVAAFQARSVTDSALNMTTFDNAKLNWTALVELVLAVLITQLEVFRRLFDTVQLGIAEWALSLLPAVVLFFVWEIGKLIARRRPTARRRQPWRETRDARPAVEPTPPSRLRASGGGGIGPY